MELKLGKFELNRIYNVDCYAAIKEIPDNSIDLIYTDVPYDVEGNGGGGCFGEKKRDYHKEYEAICKNSETGRIHKNTLSYISRLGNLVYGIDYSILDEFCRVLKAINCYIWCSKKTNFPAYAVFCRRAGLSV